MTGLASKIGSYIVQNALSDTSVTLDSFWRDQSCVITFFRRLGCKFCRLEASYLSKLKPALDNRHVKLIGISFDKDGVKEFVDGKFFTGDLYLDVERKTYEGLGFKPVSAIWGFFSLFTKAGRSLNSEANTANISGNLTGDGWQTGGLIVVEKGGKVLYEFKQEQVVNHPDYGKILEVLKIDSKEVPDISKFQTASGTQCTSDACTKP